MAKVGKESKIKEGQIWIGSNDGLVNVTIDGGKTWKDVTPNKMPKGGRVDSVEPSPHDEAKAFFSVLRYQFGDWTPYIYRTTNGGKKWKLINQGINPGHPVRVVREDPNQEGLLYAGTEYGMYISFDNGDNWSAFQQNLPITPITDIKIKDQDLVMSTMGRGFWILDNLTPLYQNANPSSEVVLYAPHKATRRYYRGSTDVPTFPRPSALIDYHLPKDADKGITMTISPVANPDMPIRVFRNIFEITDTTLTAERSMQDEFRKRGITNGLAAESGYSGTGPVVAPGRYLITLAVFGDKHTQTITVDAMDQVKDAGITQEDLVAQEQLALKIRDLRSTAQTLEKQLKKALKKNDDVQPIYDQLVTKEGRYEQPMFLNQVRYLYFMLQRADQRPGKDAYERYDALVKWYNEIEESAATIDLSDD